MSERQSPAQGKNAREKHVKDCKTNEHNPACGCHVPCSSPGCAPAGSDAQVSEEMPPDARILEIAQLARLSPPACRQVAPARSRAKGPEVLPECCSHCAVQHQGLRTGAQACQGRRGMRRAAVVRAAALQPGLGQLPCALLCLLSSGSPVAGAQAGAEPRAGPNLQAGSRAGVRGAAGGGCHPCQGNRPASPVAPGTCPRPAHTPTYTPAAALVRAQARHVYTRRTKPGPACRALPPTMKAGFFSHSPASAHIPHDGSLSLQPASPREVLWVCLVRFGVGTARRRRHHAPAEGPQRETRAGSSRCAMPAQFSARATLCTTTQI